MPRHRADGEIPPREVGGHIGHKTHPVRVPSVRIADVRAKRGDFERAVVGQNGQRAVLQAGFEHALSCEYRLHFGGLGGGAQIPVMRLCAAQTVAHAAADYPRFISRRLKLGNGARSVRRKGDHEPFLFCRSL